MGPTDDREELMPVSHLGLCADCRFAAVIRSDRGSVFWQCRRSFREPAFPKYPHLPVFTCSGYVARDPERDAFHDQAEESPR